VRGSYMHRSVVMCKEKLWWKFLGLRRHRRRPLCRDTPFWENVGQKLISNIIHAPPYYIWVLIGVQADLVLQVRVIICLNGRPTHAGGGAIIPFACLLPRERSVLQSWKCSPIVPCVVLLCSSWPSSSHFQRRTRVAETFHGKCTA
jgi:hypothetical protein